MISWADCFVTAFLLTLLAAQLFLYALRWYEIQSRGGGADALWTKAVWAEKARPLRSFVKEYLYSVLYIFTYIAGYLAPPFLFKRASPDFSRVKAGRPVTVLIHGYMARPWMFWLMGLRLRLRGVPNVMTFGYRSRGAGPGELAEKLRDFMLKVRAGTGINDVVLVGHSLGGLIAHEYARKHGAGGDVKAVVAMAAPFRGSRLSALAVTSLGRSLGPDNPIFPEIIRTKVNAPFVSIYSRYDQFVLPYTNSHHPRADENVEIAVCGHSGFYFSGAAFRAAADWIQKAAGEDARPGEDGAG